MADVTDHFARQGARFDYISPFNEPDNDFGDCGQEGMQVTPDQRDDIVRALGAEQRARHQKTSVIADESSQTTQFVSEVPQWISQPGTAQYVSALAHHTYNNPSDGQLGNVYETARRRQEVLGQRDLLLRQGLDGLEPGVRPDHRQRPADVADHLQGLRELARLGVPVVGGPAPAATAPPPDARQNDVGWNDGLIYYDPDYATNGNQKLYFTKRYYALGQYSKFVKPGSVRHPVTGAPSGVQVTATFLGGNWTLVVNNLNKSAQAVSVQLPSGGVTASGAYRTSASENLVAVGLPTVSGATASLNLPAQSITTYVFRAA